MSQAEELLNSLNEEDFNPVDPVTASHIVIDDERNVTVPDDLKNIVVQYDHNVERITFDCPRYWDGLDMSKMKVYVNYLRPDKQPGMYCADDVYIDADDPTIMHFSWLISGNVTEVKGKLVFLVCIKRTDDIGAVKNHWNSKLNDEMTISEGLECYSEISGAAADVITQLLLRMDYIEGIANRDALTELIETMLSESETVTQIIYKYFETHEPTSTEEMLEYVKYYLDKNPPLFVIGNEKPGVSCLWFDTSENGEATENVTMTLTADQMEGMYATVEDKVIGDYDYEIV